MPNDIDADIAVKVMGLPMPAPMTYAEAEREEASKPNGGHVTNFEIERNGWVADIDWGNADRYGLHNEPVEWRPRDEYSSDPAASREVIEEINRRGFDVQVYHMADGRVNAKVIDDIETVRGVAVAVDADLAICEAALAALAEEGAGDAAEAARGQAENRQGDCNV